MQCEVREEKLRDFLPIFSTSPHIHIRGLFIAFHFSALMLLRHPIDNNKKLVKKVIKCSVKTLLRIEFVVGIVINRVWGSGGNSFIIDWDLIAFLQQWKALVFPSLTHYVIVLSSTKRVRAICSSWWKMIEGKLFAEKLIGRNSILRVLWIVCSSPLNSFHSHHPLPDRKCKIFTEQI